MPGRKTSRHSEAWWDMLSPPTAVRCEGHVQDGSRCGREAILGATVCGQHGGSAPQVRVKAAARISNAADEMVKRLFAMLDDPETPAAVRAKVMQDMLDRADLGAVQKHIVGVGEIDPVERLFRDLLSDPAALAPPSPPALDPVYEEYNRQALEAYGGDDEDDEDDVVDAVIVEDTPAERPRRTGTPKHIREGLQRAKDMRNLI